MANPIIYLAVGAIGLLAYFSRGKDKKKIFVSYYAEDDSHYKNLLKAWSSNNSFKIEFDDTSADVSIKSNDASYLRRTIKSKIDESDIFLVFIGKNTHKRDWVLWEIETAKKLSKKIVAIKKKRTFKSPVNLKSCGVTWVYNFSADSLFRALEEE